MASGPVLCRRENGPLLALGGCAVIKRADLLRFFSEKARNPGYRAAAYLSFFSRSPPCKIERQRVSPRGCQQSLMTVESKQFRMRRRENAGKSAAPVMKY